MTKERDFAEDLIQYIDKSPSSFHAAKNIEEVLEAKGFKKIEMQDKWKLEKEGKIKIKEEIYRIKAVEFIGIDIRVFNEDDKLLIQTEASKDRLVYFGHLKESYVYKTERCCNDKSSLFLNNELLMSITVKGFFRTKYEIIVADDFNNHLMILTFLNFYIRMMFSA